MPTEAELNIAEIPYASGRPKFRYSRFLAPDGTRWVRHGLFVAYNENGVVSSEGSYVQGVEHGLWRTFHENGQPASEGSYHHGEEVGTWRFWGADGVEEASVKRDS